MNEFEFIIYVSDQKKSKQFYSELLKIDPVLDVEGMTEFQIEKNIKFGIMPENGIAKILKNTKHPAEGNGIPRCELYIKVENAALYISRSEKLGAKIISHLQRRNWGDKVGYVSDYDGHIIAFAETI